MKLMDNFVALLFTFLQVCSLILNFTLLPVI
jgi:hypothetical protein